MQRAEVAMQPAYPVVMSHRDSREQGRQEAQKGRAAGPCARLGFA